MSDGCCMHPSHGNCCPNFSQTDTHCRRCGGPKWRWASWSRADRNMRILAHEIAAFERGRAEGRAAVARVEALAAAWRKEFNAAREEYDYDTAMEVDHYLYELNAALRGRKS